MPLIFRRLFKWLSAEPVYVDGNDVVKYLKAIGWKGTR
jgi:hypothetical protein